MVVQPDEDGYWGGQRWMEATRRVSLTEDTMGLLTFSINVTLDGCVVGDQTIRTFEETRTAWEGDNRLIPWIGVMMLAIAFALGFSARRAYQLAQQPAQPAMKRSP